MSNLHRLETARAIQQSTAHKLESQNRSLEVTVATLGNFIQQLADTRTDIEVPGEVRRIVAQLSVVEKRRVSIGTKLYPLKVIEDNNNKYHPMKSNSTGREAQRMLKTNSVTGDTPYPLKSTLSQPNLGTKLEKVSSFFSNSHNHIRQQRAQIAALRAEREAERSQFSSSSNDENDPKTVNIDIQITDAVNDTTDGVIPPVGQLLQIETAGLEKTSSLPLSNAKVKLKSSKSAYELGSVKKVPTTKLEDNIGDSLTNVTGTIHPLDTCSDVNFKYGGTTKLKCIKPVRMPGQNGQGDNVGKEISGQNSEILTR